MAKSEHLPEVTIYRAAKAERVLIIAPAMGVRQNYYKRIAEHFVGSSYSVITFDYYGMILDPLNKHDQSIRLENFGKNDIAHVIQYARETFPGLPLFFLGHSIAGQVFPLAENANAVSAAFFVASQNVSREHWQGLPKAFVNIFWYFIIPLFVRLTGYLPGFAYGGKHRLHRNIALDWARFARTKNGMLGGVQGAKSSYRNLNVPCYFLSLDGDDTLAPQKAVAALAENYGASIKKHEHLIPEKTVGSRIGHFDFFRNRYSHLWQKADSWFSQNNPNALSGSLYKINNPTDSWQME